MAESVCSPAQPDLSDHAFTAQLLAAHSAGIAIEDYLAARAGQITHAEIVEYHAADPTGWLEPYLAARRAGATHQEVMDFADSTPSLVKDYALLRGQSITHGEISAARAVVLNSTGLPLIEYLHGRQAGVSQRNLVRAARSGLLLSEAITALTQHITFREIQRSARHKIPLSDYTAARATGATPFLIRRLTQVYGLLELRYYVTGRQAGFARAELLAALRSGIYLFLYNTARDSGATHQEVIATVAHNVCLSDYANLRSGGAGHTVALAQLALVQIDQS